MHTSEDEKSINKLRPYRSSLHFFSLDIMTNYNSFELVFCFVFNAFLNLVSSISLFFKFGNVWKKQPLEMFNKKVFLIVLQNWNWRKVPVLEQAWNIIKKESPAKEFFLQNLFRAPFYRAFPGACCIIITWNTFFYFFNLPDVYSLLCICFCPTYWVITIVQMVLTLT